jgi:hypothetical protein
MSNTTHTNGPWQMHDEDYCPEEIWGDLGLFDGAVRGTKICEIDQGNPNWLANAKLIRAAPELRERLTVLVAAIERGEILVHHIESAKRILSQT